MKTHGRWKQCWTERIAPIFAKVPGNYFVAGGAIRAWMAGEEAKDIDLFFASESGRTDAAAWFRTQGAVEHEKVGYGFQFDLDGETFDLVYAEEVASPAVPGLTLTRIARFAAKGWTLRWDDAEAIVKEIRDTAPCAVCDVTPEAAHGA